MDAKALRNQLEEARSGGGRVPPAMQKLALKFAEERRASGVSMKDIGAELGMSFHTLSYWRAVHRRQPGAALAPVKIVEPPRVQSRTTLHGPKGIRVEGLSVSQVAELILRLQ